MKASLVLLLVAPALVGCFSNPADQPGSGDPPDAPAAHEAVVVASHLVAAEAGAEMLRQGGNAIDAAAAVQWALTVVDPDSSGIGGGSFVLIYLAEEQRFVLVDGRETAPAGTREDQYQQMEGRIRHEWMGYSVGVPGTPAAFQMAHERWGALPWERTFDPAIEAAEEGFEIYAQLSDSITDYQEELRSWPASAEKFLPGAVCIDEETGCVGGVPLQPGDVLVQPDLAAAMRALAIQGTQVFYNGSIAEAVVETVGVREGTMTPDDLRAYRPIERVPISMAYNGYEVVSSPPPGGGSIVLEALGILEPLGVEDQGRLTAEGLHLVIEALRLAYADRAEHVADPAFVDVPIAGLLSPSYLDDRRSRIDPAQARDHPPGDPWAHQEGNDTSGPGAALSDGEDTTHFSIIDHQGNIVSVTTTIESPWGTGMTVPGWGFLLNDELTDFTWESGTINSPEPGKRPRSSTSPIILLNDQGAAQAALGSPGGTTIPATVTVTLLNLIAHELALDQAVEAGRFLPLSPFPFLQWDRELPPEAAAGLVDRGHIPLKDPTGDIGDVYAVARDEEGAWRGWADSRGAPGGVVVVEPQ